MTLEEMKAEFDRLAELPHDDPGYATWDKLAVTVRRSPFRDMHGMLLLAHLDPTAPTENGGDMVSAAEHDIIYYDVDPEVVVQNILTSHVWELWACGISYDTEYDCFSKFV